MNTTNTKQPEIELVTPQEVAKLLRVKYPQFRDRICKKQGFPKPLNTAVMGSIKRWKREDIINWVNNN